MNATNIDRKKSKSKNLAAILSPQRQISKENNLLSLENSMGQDSSNVSVIKAKKNFDYQELRNRSISVTMPASPNAANVH